ncbi:MAG: hypothetical protein PHX34_04320 [Candidatus Shapirobacteria bacterium]|nr:hypothetical protein [Candidatus Shapirobacteria bacterium]
MIKRVYVSELDRHNLSKQKTTECENRDTFDYKNIVVKKPWGYEYLLFENDFVAIWILHLKKNNETSVHCHPNKKTSLVVLSGKVLSSTLSEWFDLNTMDGLILESGVFHTSKAVSDDVFIMEIETPPNKKDLVRLKDSYGREGQGYEGKNKMTSSVKKYKNFYFEEDTIVRSEKKIIGSSILQMSYCNSNVLNREIDCTNSNIIYVFLEDKVQDLNQKEVFGVGNIFVSKQLDQFENIKIFNKSLLFSIKQK